MRSLEVTGMMAGIKESRRHGNTQLVGFEVEISCKPVKDPRSCYDKLEEAYYTIQRLVNESRFSILVDQRDMTLTPTAHLLMERFHARQKLWRLISSVFNYQGPKNMVNEVRYG
ncbi:hypothetical protein DPMN_160439 [Dreissena polymorpha]|uniref:Uncharacterized protein n=1 Tax=Dreissena polymorpha TaxID=45954 RepID=A0A9D4ER81_DREPO|nr:hypothetical protein DPMN_160439 [Dreissena polymorpha]